MLHIKKIKKTYGNFLALEISDFFVEQGIYWVKGVNGSGKSTLLKTIAGLISFEGDIILNSNISIKTQDVAFRRLVNFAEAEPVFPEFLSGKDLINLFLDAKEAPANQELYYIESMKMQTYIDRPIGIYSSGMLKKLSIVLAFIGNPKLILLDEPLNTLDSESLDTLYTWIEEKHKQDGTSFLLSSHQDLNWRPHLITQNLLLAKQKLKFS